MDIKESWGKATRMKKSRVICHHNFFFLTRSRLTQIYEPNHICVVDDGDELHRKFVLTHSSFSEIGHVYGNRPDTDNHTKKLHYNSCYLCSLIQSSLYKVCDLDPIPSSLLRDCLPIHGPICQFISWLFYHATCVLKEATCLDPACIKKHQLIIISIWTFVSNLRFSSKIIEI